jgi:hypothetical protein
VAVFAGTGVNDVRVEFAGEPATPEILSIPVQVTTPRNFAVVQFTGYFELGEGELSVDCTVNHVIDGQFGCGVTPAQSVPPNGGKAIVPGLYLLRDLPTGTPLIGIAIQATAGGIFHKSASALVVTVYPLP